jgi:hypothetical protein
MKKSFTFLFASLLCITVFAQGKVGFSNDSLHLVYWNPSVPFLGGEAVNSDNMVAGLPGLTADLYMGTSSSQLSLVSTTTFGSLAAGPGKWTPVNVTVPGILGGGGSTPVFVEIGVTSTEKNPPTIFDPAALQTFQAHGMSVEFSFTLGSSIIYPVLWGLNGDWPPGTFNMDQYGVGSRGAIEVNVIPEPSVYALASLGGTALLLFRRRR